MARGQKRSSAQAHKHGETGSWPTVISRRNDAFELFYKGQRMLPDEEWDAFLGCLQSDLPTAFRVVTITPHRFYIRKFLQETVESLRGKAYIDTEEGTDSHKVTGDSIEEVHDALKPLPWYKTGNEAFQLNVSRHALRSLHRFLVDQSEAGTIFRQEAVSMIPALFLEKEMRVSTALYHERSWRGLTGFEWRKVPSDCRLAGDSFVLDMCAAPGSKTSQLLEALHNAAERERCDEHSSDVRACDEAGAIVANDADVTRSHMSVIPLHTSLSAASLGPPYLERLCRFIHSHQDLPLNGVGMAIKAQPTGTASIAPAQCQSVALGIPLEGGETCQDTHPQPLSPILFDGVLCDAPCSGDGTLRKSRFLWASWSPHQGLGCHRLQLQILLRGIKLCKVGGRIVYSTCAFNPIENEAVVNAAIVRHLGSAHEKTKTKGAVVLEDCTGELPSLKRSQGMSHWQVEWEGQWYDSYEKVPKTAKAAKKIRPSMFPPQQQPGSENVPLHRCMRFYPHINNTGGFFVAVLRKVRDVPSAPVSNAAGTGCIQANKGKSSSSLGLNEVADSSPASDKRETYPVDGEDPESVNGGDVASNVGEFAGVKVFDQMQLDMACLDWKPEIIQRQHQQLILQLERLKGQAGKEDLQRSVECQSGGACPVVPPTSCLRQKGHAVPLCLTESAFEQTIRLIFRTLDIPHNAMNRRAATSDWQQRLSGLRSQLFFRIQTTESGIPLGGEPAETGALDKEPEDWKPRRVFLVSQGVKRLVESVGASRYKIVNGGCLAFQARCKGVYRTAYGGAQWIAPICEAASRLANATENTTDLQGSCERGTVDSSLSQTVRRCVFEIPCKVLYRLVDTEHEKRRVDLCKIEEIPSGDTIVRQCAEGPLLFLAKLPRAASGSDASSSKVAVGHRKELITARVA